MCEMSVLEGLWGKNTDKEGVAGGRVNAQAFSYFNYFNGVTMGEYGRRRDARTLDTDYKYIVNFSLK